MMVLNFNQLDLNKKYNYADYLTWKFSERVELIKGKIFKMSPAPSLKHQRISWNISIEIGVFLKKHSCEAFNAPVDVCLPLPGSMQSPDKIDTIVQPDIIVVCDSNKVLPGNQSCMGAPDLVVEILSPGNTKKEMKDKFLIYQNAKVKEYWVVDPEHEFVLVYYLNKQDKFIASQPITNEDTLKSKVLAGLEIEMQYVF